MGALQSHSGIVVVYVEGNIGCGKTTLLEYLKSKGEVVVPEGVSEWTFLEKFYNEGSKWAFQLQTEIAISMKENFERGLKEAQRKNKDFLFVERSIMTCKLFSNTQFSDVTNQDNCAQQAILERLYKHLMPSELESVTFYLSLPPDECWRRVQHRQRPEEQNVTQDYIYKMHKKFEEHFDDTDRIEIDPKLTVEQVGKQLQSYVYANI